MSKELYRLWVKERLDKFKKLDSLVKAFDLSEDDFAKIDAALTFLKAAKEIKQTKQVANTTKLNEHECNALDETINRCKRFVDQFLASHINLLRDPQKATAARVAIAIRVYETLVLFPEKYRSPIAVSLKNNLESYLKVICNAEKLTLTLLESIKSLQKVDPNYLPNSLPAFLTPPRSTQSATEFQRRRFYEYTQAKKKKQIIAMTPDQFNNETCSMIAKEKLETEHDQPSAGTVMALIQKANKVDVDALRAAMKKAINRNNRLSGVDKIKWRRNVIANKKPKGIFCEVPSYLTIDSVVSIFVELFPDTTEEEKALYRRFLYKKTMTKTHRDVAANLSEFDLKTMQRIRYLDAAEREEYRKFIYQGRLYEVRPGTQADEPFQIKPASTRGYYSHTKHDRACWVINARGEMYFNSHNQGKDKNDKPYFFHSSFTKGSWVIFPGEIEVDDEGYVTCMTDYSGHYETPLRAFYHAYRYLKDRGLDFSRCKFGVYDGEQRKSMMKEYFTQSQEHFERYNSQKFSNSDENQIDQIDSDSRHFCDEEGFITLTERYQPKPKVVKVLEIPLQETLSRDGHGQLRRPKLQRRGSSKEGLSATTATTPAMPQARSRPQFGLSTRPKQAPQCITARDFANYLIGLVEKEKSQLESDKASLQSRSPRLQEAPGLISQQRVEDKLTMVDNYLAVLNPMFAADKKFTHQDVKIQVDALLQNEHGKLHARKGPQIETTNLQKSLTGLQRSLHKAMYKRPSASRPLADPHGIRTPPARTARMAGGI